MGPRASSSHERNALQTRRAILDTARELFRRNGYAGTTVHSIAERLQLTDPAVYYYFGSKQQLWQDLLEDVVVATLPPQGIPSPAELVDWLVGFFFAYVDHAEPMAMLFREQLGGDRASGDYREHVEASYADAVAEPLARFYGKRAPLLIQTMTTMLSGMFWDGILTFGSKFRDVAMEEPFRARVRRAIELPLGLPRSANPCEPAWQAPVQPAAPNVARPVQAPPVRGRTATRNRILEAATELFSINGVDGTSVRAIAERCGLSDPAVYYYFPSKSALLDALWDARLEARTERSSGADEGATLSLAGIVDAALDSAAQMDSQLRLLLRQVLAGDQAAQAMRNQSKGQWHDYLMAYMSTAFEGAEALDRVDGVLAATMGTILLAQMEHPLDFASHARSASFHAETLAIVTTVVHGPEQCELS